MPDKIGSPSNQPIAANPPPQISRKPLVARGKVETEKVAAPISAVETDQTVNNCSA